MGHGCLVPVLGNLSNFVSYLPLIQNERQKERRKKKGNLKCSGENQQAPWKKLKDTDITFVFNYTTFILVEQVYFTDKDDF